MGDSVHDHAATYTECYVAILDVLGLKNLVRRSKEEKAVLPALIRGLSVAATLRPTLHGKATLSHAGPPTTDPRPGRGSGLNTIQLTRLSPW